MTREAPQANAEIPIARAATPRVPAWAVFVRLTASENLHHRGRSESMPRFSKADTMPASWRSATQGGEQPVLQVSMGLPFDEAGRTHLRGTDSAGTWSRFCEQNPRILGVTAAEFRLSFLRSAGFAN